MSILLLDSSRNSPILALADRENLSIKSPHLHSFLLQSLEDLLQEYSLTLENLSALAIGIGPGRFAATRGGVALFSSLAKAANLPLIPFTSPLLYLPSIEGSFLYVSIHQTGLITTFSGTSREMQIVDISPISSESREDLLAKISSFSHIVTDTPDRMPINNFISLGEPNPSALLPFLEKKLSAKEFAKTTPIVHYSYTPS